MKIKSGFVTNSSSTNFFVAWLGKFSDLNNLLLKFCTHFPTEYLNSKTTHNEIINCIIEKGTEEFSKPSEKYVKDIVYSFNYPIQREELKQRIIDISKKLNIDYHLELFIKHTPIIPFRKTIGARRIYNEIMQYTVASPTVKRFIKEIERSSKDWQKIYNTNNYPTFDKHFEIYQSHIDRIKNKDNCFEVSFGTMLADYIDDDGVGNVLYNNPINIESKELTILPYGDRNSKIIKL